MYTVVIGKGETRTSTGFLILKMSLLWAAICHLPFAILYTVKVKIEFSWSIPFKQFWLLKGMEFGRPALMPAYQASTYHYPPPPPTPTPLGPGTTFILDLIYAEGFSESLENIQ